MTSCKAVLSLAVLLFASLALAQGTYTQIDVPGAVDTGVQGVDSAGDICGYYADQEFIQHGFVIAAKGSLYQIDYPGATYSFAYGINDRRQVVGEAALSNGDFDTAFVYDLESHAFTSIGYPGAIVTTPVGINDAGTVAGSYFFADGHQQGFELTGSTYTSFAPPYKGNVFVGGISGSGKVFGYVSGNTEVGFSFDQGQYAKVTIPGLLDPRILGVNKMGNALVGFYDALPPATSGGFVYQNKAVQTLQFPGSNETWAYGVNDNGEVVGIFYDANGNLHGFTWMPPAAAEKK